MLKLPVGISSNGENKKYIVGFPTKNVQSSQTRILMSAI
jgi:hypothetical protein